MTELDDIDLQIQSIVDTNEIEELTSHTLTPTKTKLVEIAQPDDEPVDDKTFDKDFEYIRKNLKDIIKNGSMALEQMILVAQQSEHPRAYEVVATLMKTLADANKDLLASHKSRDDRSTITKEINATTNVQNNTVFVGSTAEFSKLFKQQMKEAQIDG